ncbi:B-cell receptor CD22-like [Halichoeres trimaculatus]|uniref:B-cell receptor CD22-like n=1 Tax=Halichoeres trimaculatus TaxID=147232 RepID=UPI003D9E0EB9
MDGRTAVRGQTDWGVTYSSHQICASKGSTVDIPCTYTYPPRIDELDTKVEETLWFTNLNGNQSVDLRPDPDYSGRVEYLFKQNDCTLRIKDLRETDSAEYKFNFTTNQQAGRFTGSPGVTLTVTDLQVKVNGSSTEADLRCESSCKVSDNPSYVWYKDGEEMNEQTSSLRVSDFGKSYSCALKNHEDQRSAAVYAPKTPSVSQSPSGEVMEGRAVTLTCSSDANPTPEYTWFKAKAINGFQLLAKEAQLVFSSIQSFDSGEYYCEAENRMGKSQSKVISIKVKYAATFCSVSVNPLGEIRENSRVTLTCSSDGYPTPEYTWYKRDQQSYRHYDAPKPPSVSVSPSGEIVEGSSVTLTCSSDANPAANYTWYKEDENLDLQLLREGSQLLFEHILLSDFGFYSCEAGNKLGRRRSGNVNVNPYYAPKTPSVSVSPSGEIVEGSSVNLTCSSDANPTANYTWYKENEDWLKASGEIFIITYSRAEHSGDYVCVAQNEKGHHNSTVHVTVVGGSSTLQIHLIRLTLMLLMMTPLLLLTLWMRKKKTGSSTTEPNEPAEMMELDSDPDFEDVSAVPAAQTEDTEEQEDMMELNQGEWREKLSEHSPT